MKILLHICCAPCLIYPLETLNAKDHEVTGFFSNNNIHPFTEFKKRLDTLKDYAEKTELTVICDESYNINEFLRKTANNEDKKCELCYTMRLTGTALLAKEGGFDAFTTTLLYSKYQNHELIKKIALDLSEEYGITFYYEDFRTGWGRGIKKSKKLGIYRQKYCGCIYSERERYFKEG
jgi:predicted adenine nucleotide alpha hydrolase (AANH) superfamily ATPase